MKTFVFALLVTVSVVSCKKNNTDATQKITCEETVADIAGTYHLTKVEQVDYFTGAVQDITATINNCTLSGIFILHIDSTAIYTELSTCSGSGAGTWNVAHGSLFTSFTSGNGYYISGTSIISWDCTNLVLQTLWPSVQYNHRYTLTRDN